MWAWALGVAALGGLTARAAGQTDEPAYPPMTWAAQESLFSHADARDEGMDLVYWEEIIFAQPNKHWVYVTGWVTEMDEDEVVGTRFATFKYDAEFDDNGNPPDPDKFAYFPDPNDPTMPLSAGEEYKAVAMAIDDSADDVKVYVVGQAPRDDSGVTSDLNYCVIKYDKDLVQKEIFYYDGPVSGDDIPVDISWAGGKVIVTGTSPGSGTGKDIATLALNDADLTLDGDAWPSSTWGGPGERRYNHTVNGDDRAVQLGTPTIVISEDQTIIDVVLVGTSWGGSSKKDDYITLRWGELGGNLVHAVRYDTPLNDVATGITDDGGPLVFVTGYSEAPSESFGPTGPEVETDYATLGYTIPHASWDPVVVHWEERWDYADGRDFARDIEMYSFPYPVGPCSPPHIWVTGAGGVGAGDFDVATIRYVHDDDPSGPLESWSDGWARGSGWQYAQAMTVIGDEPYIVGAIGSSTSDRMLAVKYDATGLPLPDPPYEEDWFKTYLGGGAYTGGVNHEARKVIVTVNGTFIVGVSTVTGEGQQFTTWRYVE